MAALFKPSGPESFAESLNAHLVGAAVVDHAYAPDTTCLSMGRKQQRRPGGDRRKRRDDPRRLMSTSRASGPALAASEARQSFVR